MAADDDDRAGAYRCARGHADDARLGQWIGEDALKQRAGTSERCADQIARPTRGKRTSQSVTSPLGWAGIGPMSETDAVHDAAEHLERRGRHLTDAGGDHATITKARL